jgi:hypothetical protein
VTGWATRCWLGDSHKEAVMQVIGEWEVGIAKPH